MQPAILRALAADQSEVSEGSYQPRIEIPIA
jgi:hypothetical protein